MTQNPESVEKESNTNDFQDNIAYWLDSLTLQVAKRLAEVALPYNFSWRDIEILRAIRDADGGLPLTRLLYPNGLGGLDNKTGQDLFQRFKDAAFLEVIHSDDAPVMIELTEIGKEYVDSRQQAYVELGERLTNAVGADFLKDLKAVQKALSAKKESHA